MSVEVGSKLGGHEVASLIGRGGMGEVWLAKDPRLARDVAIKVLPESMARDKERVLRFEREARLLASLSHPNIAAIHGFDEADGKKFLVLEYVSGRTLAERLKDGALAVDEALDICRQIAQALEAAHDKGVIHRDLKPGNVMVTGDGTVKVLDFGLARAVDDAPAVGVASDSPTITAEHTRPGVVLGTAPYMSPEQARGRPLDPRSDIWSFGVILYECLTGRMLFSGDTATDTMGAILHKEFDLDALPQRTPPTVRRLLRRCLQRDKHKRLQAAGDARVELEEAVQQLESGAVERVPAGMQRPRSWMWPVIAGVLAVALGMSLMRSRQAAAPGASETAVHVTRMQQLTDLPGIQEDGCLSADGRMLLYVAGEGGDRDIFLQRVGGQNAINLTSDSPLDDFDPVFSPTADRIAFRSQREGGGIFIMGATGESPRRLTDSGYNPVWSPDGAYLVYTTEDVIDAYSRTSTAQLWRVAVASGERRMICAGDAVEPAFSPSGKRIAFWGAVQGVRDIWTIATEGGSSQMVTRDRHTDWNPFFAPDGQALYFISDRSGTSDLWRLPIDATTGEVRGDARPVTAGVSRIDEAGISSDGTRITFTARSHLSEFLRMEFDPATERVVGTPDIIYASNNALTNVDVSPDGKRIVFRTAAPREDLVVVGVDGSGVRRLTDDVHRDRGPAWSPDGEWLMFYSNRGGSYEIWIMRPDGTDARPITESKGQDLTQPFLSPDGRLIAGTVGEKGGFSMPLFELDQPLGEITEPLPLPEKRLSGQWGGPFSPDGRWIAGGTLTATEGIVVSLYDVEAGRSDILRGPGGGAFAAWPSGISWIDAGRVAFWDANREAAYVWDVQVGEARELPDVPGPCEMRFHDGGRTLIVHRQRSEADIWMLHLASGAGEPL